MRFSKARLLQLVRKEFGPNMEKLSPAGARDFLDRLYREFHVETHKGGPIEISESARSYEEIMSQFFVRALEAKSDDAVVMLWLHAFEQHFAAMEEQYIERFVALFENPDTFSEGEDEQE